MTVVNRVRNRSLRPRYVLLDALRGICVVSMALYHGLYDLFIIKGYPAPWYRGWQGYLWQQSICWCFIFLSGMCWQLSRAHVRRGVLLVICGAAVTLVTRLVMPEQQIHFGILTLLGLSCLLLNLLVLLGEKLGKKLPPGVGFFSALLLFFLLRNLPRGSLGFEGLAILRLPEGLYRWDILAVLGLPSPSFYSSDYFPLIPWFFLYLAGYFAWSLIARSGELLAFLKGPQDHLPALLRAFAFLGRHSLLIYLAHQPLLMAVFWFVPYSS